VAGWARIVHTQFVKPCVATMINQQPPKTPAHLDALDFEITDFDEARRALDELPAGLQAMQQRSPGYWEHKRRGTLPSDRALTGTAMDWIVALPPTIRPHTTCEQFPRVANAIADSWEDVPLCTRVLDHMLQDYRGGRRGFPATVQAELSTLMQHQQQRPRR
jgi:hypothetical protein